jgi:hypothetical protein
MNAADIRRSTRRSNMNAKLLSASIVFGLTLGFASPLQAQVGSGAISGGAGQIGGIAHGRFDAAAGGSAAAGLPDRPGHGGLLRRGADKTRDTAGRAGETTRDRAEHTGAQASSRGDSARTRAGLLADGATGKGTDVAGRASERADDARPTPERPDRPAQPVDAEVGALAPMQGNADAGRSGARADAGGTPSVMASGRAPRGAEASAEASGSAAVEAGIDSSR